MVTSRADMRLLYPGFRRSSHDLLTVADKYISPDSVVWDIGSNLGIFAFCAAHRAGRSGKVFSVEADPKYAELQNRTIAQLPRTYAPVTTLCAAVADQVGVLELCIPKNGHARNHLSIVAGNDAGNTEARKAVVAVTLDWLLQRWPDPNFVKLDVEGAEVLALLGARNLLHRARPVFYLESSPENQQRVSAILRSYNYRFYDAFSNREIGECQFETIALPT